MIILGLHFGHDASISLLQDGKIVFCIEKERTSKVRHVIGITYNDIKKTLESFNYSINDIDFCCVTSTQDVEYIFFDKNKLHFELDLNKIKGSKNHWYHKNKIKIHKQIKEKNLLKLIQSRKTGHPYLQKIEKKNLKLEKVNYFGSLENFYEKKEWKKKCGLGNLKSFLPKKIWDNEHDEDLMQLPIIVKLGKFKISGYIVSHHFAHAAYCYYTSNYNEAAIITQDGSMPLTPYLSGMCYFGRKNKLYPVVPHYLNLGRTYDSVSELIGFDRTSGPGKTMGLAPYGKPKFFNKKFIGNFFDHKRIKIKNFKNKKINWKPHRVDFSSNKWISYCMSNAKRLNYDFKNLGNPKKILSPINTDIASSTQLLLEETILFTVKKFKEILKLKNINTKNLCLSGGTFLNCPANSKIFNKKIYKNIFIPPAIHDGGLSIGSVLAIYHNELNYPKNRNFLKKSQAAYLGLKHNKNLISKVKKKYKNKLLFKKQNNIYQSIGSKLSRNKIVGVFFGRSEIGPRALGHRSILADARKKNNWVRVNKIKSREHWRPFAPAVLKKDFKRFFNKSPTDTPYMLFTANVKNKNIPAITHVDNSSRVQSVDDKTNPLFKILTEFKKITGLPILMNTSFNGPGQPIVETYEDALNFFKNSKLDFLYINNFEISKKHP